MAIHVVSTSVSFVRQFPLTLCCLPLLFIPPIYRLLLFFTPLLASTALCVLALVSWVPNRGGPNAGDRKLNKLFEDTKEEETKECKRSKDGCISEGVLVEGGNNEECEEGLEGNDGEREEAHAISENSADLKSEDGGEAEAGLNLWSGKAVGESEDGGAGVAVERDAGVVQEGMCSSSEGRNGEFPSMTGGEGELSPHEKVIAKLKMAMEKEVAALETSLMAPHEPSIHWREEEHHHHLILPSPSHRASC